MSDRPISSTVQVRKPSLSAEVGDVAGRIGFAQHSSETLGEHLADRLERRFRRLAFVRPATAACSDGLGTHTRERHVSEDELRVRLDRLVERQLENSPADDLVRSSIRARAKHVFAQQKDHMDLFTCTIGLARATPGFGFANPEYQVKTLITLGCVKLASLLRKAKMSSA